MEVSKAQRHVPPERPRQRQANDSSTGWTFAFFVLPFGEGKSEKDDAMPTDRAYDDVLVATTNIMASLIARRLPECDVDLWRDLTQDAWVELIPRLRQYDPANTDGKTLQGWLFVSLRWCVGHSVRHFLATNRKLHTVYCPTLRRNIKRKRYENIVNHDKHLTGSVDIPDEKIEAAVHELQAHPERWLTPRQAELLLLYFHDPEHFDLHTAPASLGMKRRAFHELLRRTKQSILGLDLDQLAEAGAAVSERGIRLKGGL